MANRDSDRIEAIFHSALDLEPEERDAFLISACSDDVALYAEVKSLIAAFEDGDSFFEEAAFDLGMRVMASNSTGSMSGKEVGGYRILSPLGKGGMGEVYLAEDTRLGRNVALKFLSSEFIGDNWAKRQLIKEAQSVAMLDHPNICTVHGIEEFDGQSFMVMQYVEGQTLADLIRSNSLSANQILPLAQQIATALAEAHAHGIIHRDIKPRNIMVTPTGQVKVLDFGLAKTIRQGQSLETESIGYLSQAGLVIGTVAYMSPEQLRGERLDYRSDIFSFGTVLHEMLFGTNPYAHGSNAEIISAILSQDPAPVKNTSSLIHRELCRIVQRCSKKTKSQRYQSINDLIVDLESLERTTGGQRPRALTLSIRATSFLALLALTIAVFAFVYTRFTRPRTIAVLPFVNETGNPDLEYMGDGLTDSIISRLSGLSKLRVKARTVVSGYKGDNFDPKRIGQELHVDAVLTGRIIGSATSPNLEATLVDTADGSQLWKAQYALDSEKVFAVETDVAGSVTATLVLRPTEDERRIRSARRAQNPEAGREYWLGRYFFRNRDNNNALELAIAHFDAAIKLEPTYASAHAGKADCFASANSVAYGHMNTKEAMTKAEQSARDALDLDETLPEAHTSLGMVNLKYRWNWTEAEKHFKRAIELDPDYAPAHYGYSSLLTVTGRHTESLTQSEKARDLDPFSPASALNVCRVIYFARRYDQATACFDKLVQDQPNYKGGLYARGLMYLQQGKHPEALAIFEDLYKKDKRLAGAALGYTYGLTGRKVDARRVLSEMQQLLEPTNLPPQEIALIYLGLGEIDSAVSWLEKAADEHFAPLLYLSIDPLFDNLHSDPRFLDLARRYNLPLPHPAT
ncbi:MAG: eukaryotic-like serine/threonine-protein kinase [Blastocatellia bacterium]|nr:eukaryotic-like serine/threonine-protein kinase [Blastocatellia bacterium]